MDVRRVHPEEDENDIAAEQVRDLLGRVPCRNAAAPLFVFDAGYDPVELQRGFDELPLQLLVRLHSNRVFYADPETPEKRPVGRPYRHGAKFDFHDPETWPDPTHEHHCETEDYGKVRVRAWSDLHPKGSLSGPARRYPAIKKAA